ncbi:DUF6668 family protein [Nocardia carnea]|uniref:DUF6668 family protein n=1 Tax=Nocardia carnea TaxID=37328 RepID=UPI002455997B|nr:DUF6668 family protein [Nocardia carnea]
MSEQAMSIEVPESDWLMTRHSREPLPKRSARAVVAPPLHLRAPVWDRPVPVADGQRPPLVWLLGAHGGAGTTSLERLLAPAADCYRRWPAPIRPESPYVLVVARETAIGLAAADALLRQHHAGLAGVVSVIGLVTVAARPGRIPAPIRRDRELYGGLVEHMWRVGWHEAWTTTSHRELPVWTPGDEIPAKGRDDLASPPPDITRLGQEVLEAIDTLHHRRSERNGGMR